MPGCWERGFISIHDAQFLVICEGDKRVGRLFSVVNPTKPFVLLVKLHIHK